MELMAVKEVRAVAETVVSGPVAAKRALVAAWTAVVEMAVASVVVVVESTAAAAAADVVALEVVPSLGQMMVASAVKVAGVDIDFVAAAVVVIEDRKVLFVESVGAILEERAIGDHIPNADAANQSREPTFW